MNQFKIRSCSDDCGNNRKIGADELTRLADAMAHEKGTIFYCGYCNNGQNEYELHEMFYDIKEELAITPCCHTEATEALKCYCAEGGCPDDIAADEERLERYDYIHAQTGR